MHLSFTRRGDFESESSFKRTRHTSTVILGVRIQDERTGKTRPFDIPCKFNSCVIVVSWRM